MTGPVLTPKEVDWREVLYLRLPSIDHRIDAIFHSHRLLALLVKKCGAKIEELEAEARRNGQR